MVGYLAGEHLGGAGALGAWRDRVLRMILETLKL